ncbi:MAG: transcription initiation factor IIB family protein [Candidatus Thorarchaeota archaeon]
MFVSNERRAYSIEEISKRRQTEPSWRKFGPRTILPIDKIDSKGESLNANKRVMFSRLSKIQRSLVNSLERNFWEAKPKLKLYAAKLNIPEYIRETAWRIYTEVAKKKLTIGRSIDGFVAASLYAAIRIHEFPKLLEDVIGVSLVPQRTLFRSLGMIIKEILPMLHLEFHPISPAKLIFLFGNKLELPIELQIDAINILKKIVENTSFYIGKDPKGLAAALVYFVAKETKLKKTQKEVANIAKVTEVTIRSRLKDIKNLMEENNEFQCF